MKYVCRGNECYYFGIDGYPKYTQGGENVIYGSGDIGYVFVNDNHKMILLSYFVLFFLKDHY